MFITKKKFNEALEAARAETADKIYQNERFYKLEENVNIRLNRLEKKVHKLEHPNEEDKPDNGKIVVPEY